jgi:RHS repeat-associated protein
VLKSDLVRVRSFTNSFAVKFLHRRAKERVSFPCVQLIVAFLLLWGVCSPAAHAQDCNVPPGWRATIWLPAVEFPNYVGGQATPWYLHIDWSAPCPGSTITVTTDNGQNQPPVTLLTLPLSGTSGTYDNGSPQQVGGPDPNGGFASPPPVAHVTPWTTTLTGTVASDPTKQSTSVSVTNLVPLKMSIELKDNKIVAAPGASTVADVTFNVTPSPTWFHTHSVQSSNPDVNVNYTWPDGAGNIPITLSDSQVVTTASSETITAELDSSNGIQVTASAQLSVQPPGDPGPSNNCGGQAGAPINLGTGNVWICEKDYSLPGLSGGLQLTRTWNSKWQNLAPPAVSGLFGHSWQTNFEEQLFFPDPNSITYYRGDGSSWVFALNGAVSAQYWSVVSPATGVHARLSNSANQYSLTLPDGTLRVFSQSGLLLAMVDRNGNQTTLTYDGANRLSAVTDAAGRSITFSYGDANNPSEATIVQDSVGVIANYLYDATSRLVQVTYADGSSLNFTYGSNSMITSVTDSQGKVLESHIYDAADRGLTSSRAGGADLVTVNFSPGLTQLSDSLGNSTTYNLQYTGGSMLVNSTAGPGCASCGDRGNNSYIYDLYGHRTSSTDGLGNLTCYTYDFGTGDILTKTLLPPGSSCPGGGGVFLAVTGPTAQAAQLGGTGISSANASGSIPSTFCTGGAGNSSRFCTSSSGSSPAVSAPGSRAVSPMLALSPAQSSPSMVTWTYQYNNFREIWFVTDPAGNTTANNYDAKGNLLSTITPSPDGTSPRSTTSFAYDSKGEPISVTDPNGNLTSISYTPAGLIASTTDAQNHSTTFTYDARGNRLSSTDAMNQTTNYTYDVMNRLTRSTAPDGSSTSFGYDYRGRRTSVTDANGKTTSYQFDDADRLVAVTDPAGHATSYQYNTENELTRIADAAGRATSFAYNLLGHITQVTFPSTLTESYTYDAVENLLSKTDRKGQTIHYAYDFRNRVTSKTYPGGPSLSYTYDVLSHLTQVTDPTGTYSFSFDNMGRLTSTSTQYAFLPNQTLGNGYAYDANSNRVSLANPQGGATTYNYDPLNRLTSLTDFAGRLFSFTYDALGRRIGLTRPNGVNTSYTYDSLSRLLSVLHQTGSAALDGASYAYDAAGNRTSKTVLPSNLTSAYSYDPVYELTKVMQGTTQKESYAYDAVGNRTYQPGAPYTYNSSNEMLTRESVPYTYDANGSTLSKRNGSGTTSYAWDFENRLTSVTLPTGSVVSFQYDPFGRRISKSSPSGSTTYVYDGDNIIEELTGSTGTLGERYTYGPGIDEPLVGQRQPLIFYYEADGLGSVTSLTTPTGTVAATYTYDSFGFMTNSTGSATNWFRYTARQFDSDTALYYYRARYYDPTTGRFISEDPIRFQGGTNFYRYLLNDPMDATDPWGLKLCKTTLPGIGDTYLDDSFFPLVKQWIALNEASGVDFSFVSGFRTTNSQSRLASDPTATTPAPPGSSLHEAGFAVDVNFPAALQTLVVANAQAAGLNWGGNFKKPGPDPRHFYHDPGNRSDWIKNAQEQSNQGAICDCSQ